MSEGLTLAEVMLFSSGFISIERPVITWSSRLRNRRNTFSNNAVFINKPQIWVLNNYILAWNTRVQCRQTLAVAARHVRCRHGVNVTHLSRRNKATSASDRRPFRSLSSLQRWKADPIQYLHMSYFLPYRSADVFLFCFHPPSLSFCHSARLFTEHCSISWVDTPLNADWLQVCFGTRPWLSFLKRFWKIAYPAFKQSSNKCSELILTQASNHNTKRAEISKATQCIGADDFWSNLQVVWATCFSDYAFDYYVY